MPENKEGSITENGRQSSVPPKKGWFDSLLRVSPLLVFTIAFIGLLFTIHKFIHDRAIHVHDREKENSDEPLKEHSFFSSLASKEKVVEEGGGTVTGGDFYEGGWGQGFMSTKKGEVISFPIGNLTNLKAGTVEMCVTLKQKLKDEYDYFLFSIDDNEDSVLLQIAWNKMGFHNVRLKVQPTPRNKGSLRVLTSKINWQPGEHHHIAATWGPEGRYIYIDGELDISDQYKEESKENSAWGRENLDMPIVINNLHHKKDKALQPTYCVVSHFRIDNYQKNHEEMKKSHKKSYDELRPKQDERE